MKQPSAFKHSCRCFPLFAFSLCHAAVVLAIHVPRGPADSETVLFVKDGQPNSVITVGKPWEECDGFLQCSGQGNHLFGGKGLGAGDVHIKIRLALDNLDGSAASIDIDRGHFGFDAGGGKGMFVSGEFFGKLKFLGPYTDYISPGEPFDFELVREGEELTVLINQQEVYQCRDPRKRFGVVGCRPWRSTMRVYQFQATGQLEKAVIPTLDGAPPEPFPIPTIDITDQTERHVIVAQGTETEYKGHPTTVLLPDGKTMFCVYPLGHGGPSAVLRRSDDGGRSWSEPLDVPDNWKESNNCPALYRFVGPDDVARLFVFEGNGRMRQAVSNDAGETWSPMEPNGLRTVMPFTSIIELNDGRLMGGWNRGRATYISFSDDGGLTWGPERLLAEGNEDFPGAWPCEPAFIGSPNGEQIACLMRENSRRFNSLVMFTKDEGKTWSDLRELPRTLTGDRHQPRYAADGRLVIPFRDTAPNSPTRCHFVAWVGTYGDIVEGRPGQYRIKLLHSYGGCDQGYPGNELLPDGTFVITTYIKYRPGPEKQSVVSTRFKLSEIDAMAKRLPQKTRLLPPGPGNARNSEGDFIRLRDGRILFVYSHYFGKGGDVSPAALYARSSSDGGKTWSQEDELIVPRDGDTSQRSVSLLRLEDGRIALFYLHCKSWADDQRAYVRFSDDEAKTWTAAKAIIPVEENGYYVCNNDRVVQLNSGRLLLPASLHNEPGSKQFTRYGRIMTYISDDAGKTWRRSNTVRTGQQPDGTRVRLQEPGIVELDDGRLWMFCRTGQGCQYESFSEDGGDTWSPFQPTEIISPFSPASIERLPTTGDLLMVWNNHKNVAPQYSGKRTPLNVAISRDEGESWENVKTLEDDPGGWYCYTAIHFADDHVLLGYCAGQRKTGGLNLTQITRLRLDWLYE